MTLHQSKPFVLRICKAWSKPVCKPRVVWTNGQTYAVAFTQVPAAVTARFAHTVVNPAYYKLVTVSP